MNKAPRPPFRADHVGSLLRPQRLIDARYAGTASADRVGLRALEDECIREVVRLQEEVGLHAVSDGEFRRHSWRSSFDGTVSGLVHRPAQAEVNLRGHVDMGSFKMDAAPFTDAKIRRTRGIVTEEFAFLRSITKETPKIALPAPSFLHFFRGENAIDGRTYPALADYFADIATMYIEEVHALEALGARYIQFDEVAIAMLSDRGVRERMTGSGIDVEHLVDSYLGLLNAVLDATSPETATAVHFCRGNSYGKSAGTGSFELIAEKVFGGIRADAIFLEFDDPNGSDFSPLRFVGPDTRVVLGLVSTKVPEIENRDELRKRIDRAATYVPHERLCVSPQCGFSSRDKGTSLGVEHEIAKLRLLVEVAETVWHSH
jgi:5-methyltetrahydropteroyltriglutamate--homocysteine methyltransferase